MASNRGNGRRQNKQAALEEQMRQVLTDMQTAAELFKTSGQDLRNASDTFAQNTGGGPYSNQTNPYHGGSPRSRGNQTSRPSHGPYPSGDLGHLRQQARSHIAGKFNNLYGGNFKPVRWDSSGNATHFNQLDSGGNVMNADLGPLPKSDIPASALRNSRIAGGFEAGGALGAIRAVPVVGTAAAAVGAVYEGAQMVSQQRQANAAYQSVLGGTNMAGLGQRFLGEGFKLQQLFSGGLSGGAAGQAFKGVTALGYQGGQRQDRLNFVSSNYRSMGMSPDESLRLISIAAQTSTTSLKDLETQLKGVSDMAKQTGQNASALRSAFTNSFQSLAQAGAGGGAGLIAQGQVGLTAGASRQYANVDLSGLQSTSSQMLQANQLGMTLGQYYSNNQTTGGMTFAQGQQKQINWAVQAAGGGSNTMAQIKAEIEKEGGSGKVAGDTGAQQRIAMKLMGQGILDPLAVGNILSSLSVDVSKISGGLPAQAAYLIMLVAKGDNSLTSQVAAGQGANARRAYTDTETKAAQYQAEAAGGGVEGTAPQNTIQKWEDTNKTVDPALEKVYGVAGDKTQLTFSDGKTVSMKDALKNNDYVNQIDAGTAVIQSGDSNTKGFSVKAKGWASTGEQVGQGDGSSTPGASGGVSVQVNMSNDAKQLLAKLGIVITGDANVEAGAKGSSPTKPSTGPAN